MTAESAPALPAALLGSTGFVVTKVAQRAVELTEAVLAPFGLKSRHFGTLVFLEEVGPASQQQIADRLRIDRTTMANIADDLERQGLALRRPHPQNRRANSLEITQAGVRTLAEVRPAIADVENQLFGGLSDRERGELHRLLMSVLARSS